MTAAYADAERVADWLRVDRNSVDLALLASVYAAVVEHVAENYIVDDPLTDAQQLAVWLQTARLWRRRDTPEGVAAFGDIGIIRVSVLDADVRALLKPKVNFA